jgi:hypothetical protein
MTPEYQYSHADLATMDGFPVDALPDAIGNHVKECADIYQCDPAMVALPCLVAAGGCIGMTRRIVLRPTWKAPAILWGAIVADSGTKKTPLFNAAFAPLEKIARALADEYEADCLRVEEARAANENLPDPVNRRLLIGDATIESVAPLLKANPRGLILRRQELAGWLNGYDSYKRGGSDAASWIELFDGNDIQIDRKGGKLAERSLYVKNAAVSVCGTIQPGTLARAINGKHTESGLAARLLFVMPRPMIQSWDFNDAEPVAAYAYAELIERLWGLDFANTGGTEPVPVDLPLAPQAATAWGDFYNFHNAEKMDISESEEALKAAFSKLENYAAKFALISALAENPGAREVDGKAMERGIMLATFFKAQAERIYAMLSGQDRDADRNAVLSLLEERGAMTGREMQQNSKRFRARRTQLNELLQEMVTIGELAQEDNRYLLPA